jgi:hypothetical protein
MREAGISTRAVRTSSGDRERSFRRPRGLSGWMLEQLLDPDGCLHPDLRAVRDDPELDLQIRDDFLNIYNRGGNLMEIRQSASGAKTLKARFDSKYIQTPSVSPWRIAPATWVGAQAVEFDIWVGLDGGFTDSHTVEQTGVTYGQQGSDPWPDYYAWYEMFPNWSVTIARAQMAGVGSQHMAVFAGDTVTASVTSLGDQRFRLTLVDDPLGESFSVIKTCPVAKCDSAEVVVEAHTKSGFLLPDFHPVHFSDCLVDGRPIGSFKGYRSEITAHDGQVLTSTSALGADGTSFTVMRR